MPFNQALSDDIIPISDAPTAAGTTTIDSTAIDMAGFTGVLFLVRFGTPAANNDIRVQQDTAIGMGAAADLAGTKVVSGANNLCAVEVILAGGQAEQFVRCRVTRGTSSTIDSIVAIRFGARTKPTTWPGSTSFEQWTSAAEGAA